MQTQKRNVSEFNSDIKANSGYRYTTNAPYSSVVANARISEATALHIDQKMQSVIDIGCGDGAYTEVLRSRFPSIKFTGFDPAGEAIAAAKKKSPQIEFLLGDLLDKTTFPGQKFDLAILRGVIHHLPDAAKGIENATLLSDKVLIIEPNGNNPILKWLEKNSRYHIDHEERSYSGGQLIEWCRLTGYQVKSLEFIGFIPFFFPTLLAKMIHLFQPLLESIYPLKKYFAAQIILLLEKPR